MDKQQDFLKLLADLYHNWNGEIPDRIVRAADSDNQYKVRNGWLNKISLILQLAKQKGYLDVQSITDFEAFQASYSKRIKQSPLTTREDIDKADAAVLSAMRCLEARLPVYDIDARDVAGN